MVAGPARGPARWLLRSGSRPSVAADGRRSTKQDGFPLGVVSKDTLDRRTPPCPSPSSPSKTCAGQKLLWSRVTLCSSNFVESDPTTAQDFESCAVVGSDSTKLDEQGGHIVVQVVSLRATQRCRIPALFPAAQEGGGDTEPAFSDVPYGGYRGVPARCVIFGPVASAVPTG